MAGPLLVALPILFRRSLFAQVRVKSRVVVGCDVVVGRWIALVSAQIGCKLACVCMMSGGFAGWPLPFYRLAFRRHACCAFFARDPEARRLRDCSGRDALRLPDSSSVWKRAARSRDSSPESLLSDVDQLALPESHLCAA